MKVLALAREIRDGLQPHGDSGIIEDDDNASLGFKESCVAYEAVAFSQYIESTGQEIRVTVEDVTPKP